MPVETHIHWMRRLLPKARNVGILFDPAQNARRAEDGAAALKRAGYTPVLEPVTAPTALPTALTRLTNTVDVLHAIPDTTVFAPEHSRALLLFSFRNRIPLAGPSEGLGESGRAVRGRLGLRGPRPLLRVARAAAAPVLARAPRRRRRRSRPRARASS